MKESRRSAANSGQYSWNWDGSRPAHFACRFPLPAIYNPFSSTRCSDGEKLFDLTGRVAMVTGGNKGWARRWPGVCRGRGGYVIASRHEDELKGPGEILAGTRSEGRYFVPMFAGVTT